MEMWKERHQWRICKWANDKDGKVWGEVDEGKEREQREEHRGKKEDKEDEGSEDVRGL